MGMAMNIDLIIKGSAICYLKDRLWHFVFITDDTHLVKLSCSDPAVPPQELRKPKTDRSVSIYVDGPDDSSPKKEPNFDEVLNMSDLHGVNNLVVKRTHNPNREVVLMTIPTGRVSRKDLTAENYYIHQIKPPGHTRYPLNVPVAASIQLNLKLSGKHGLSMVVNDGGSPHVLRFPLDTYDGKTLSLTFDNDCGEECKTANDFSLYYDWVQDVDGETQFIAGKDDTVKGLQGNCDPVVVEPPPGVPPPLL
jgi:hypothetical protein